jgi:hypothetical protein
MEITMAKKWKGPVIIGVGVIIALIIIGLMVLANHQL